MLIGAIAWGQSWLRRSWRNAGMSAFFKLQRSCVLVCFGSSCFKLTTQRIQWWSDDPRGGWVIGASNRSGRLVIIKSSSEPWPVDEGRPWPSGGLVTSLTSCFRLCDSRRLNNNVPALSVSPFVSHSWYPNINRNTPFRRPSCQAREEKRKFSPTATSLRRRRQRSRT